MPPALIVNKLELPRLPALYLERPRLDRLWGACRGRRLLLVTAGAGFGKTAFLISAAARHGGPLVWLSLDDGDAEPASFALHLHEALRRACGGEVAPLPGSGPEQQLAAALALLRAAQEPCLLVLDDVHLAAAVPAIRELIERLLRHLPAGVTLALLSREGLELNTDRLKAAGELATVGRLLGLRGVSACDLGRLDEGAAALVRADYQRYERLMIQELDLPPSPRLRTLAERISRPEPPPGPPGRAGAGRARWGSGRAAISSKKRSRSVTEVKTASSPEATCRTRPRKLSGGSPTKLTTKVDMPVSFPSICAGLRPTDLKGASLPVVTRRLRGIALKRGRPVSVQASGDTR